MEVKRYGVVVEVVGLVELDIAVLVVSSNIGLW